MDGNREAAARMLKAMAAEYRTSLDVKLAEIEALWRALAQGSLPPDGFEALHRLVHTIAGSAKTFGFPEVGDAARALDMALTPFEADAGGMLEDDLARVGWLVAALGRSAGDSRSSRD